MVLFGVSPLHVVDKAVYPGRHDRPDDGHIERPWCPQDGHHWQQNVLDMWEETTFPNGHGAFARVRLA